MIAPGPTSLAPSLAICAAGSPLALPRAILKDLPSTKMPSLLDSSPITSCVGAAAGAAAGAGCWASAILPTPAAAPRAATAATSVMGFDGDIWHSSPSRHCSADWIGGPRLDYGVLMPFAAPHIVLWGNSQIGGTYSEA